MHPPHRAAASLPRARESLPASSPAPGGNGPRPRAGWIPLFALLIATAASAQTPLWSRDGLAASDRFGASLGGRGDFDLDTRSDLVVGAPGRDAGLGPNQGAVRVVSGLTGATLLTVDGPAAGATFGSAVALDGDVDLDGRADLLASAPSFDAGLGLDQGRVVVLLAPSGLLHAAVNGGAAGDRFGEALSYVGDVNGDGRSDFAIGAPGFDGGAGSDAGRVTIHSGLDASVLLTLGGSAAGDGFGAAVAGLGDVNADGTPDIAVGSPDFDGTAGTDCGRVSVHSGVDGALLFAVEGTLAGEALGTRVAAAGDFDGDLRPDLVAGAPGSDGPGGSDSGRAVVLSGRTGSVIASVNGAGAGDALGFAVAGGGDTNGDGYDDVLVGIPGFDPGVGADAGRVVMLAGPSGAELGTIDGEAAGDAAGRAVSIVGDVDGTARDDLAVGAPLRDDAGVDRGRVRLFGVGPAPSSTGAYPTGTAPRLVVAVDADQDGDRDLVVAAASTLSVLWNGNQSGGLPRARFDSVARTDLALPPGATATSLAAGQLDADAAPEIVVGLADGTILVLDGSGSGAAVGFSVSPTSPIVVDTSPGPGAISGVAVLGSGPSARIACAGAGTFVAAGFATMVDDPLGAPTVLPALVSGGSFASVAAADLDGDLDLDLVLANTSSGVHVLLGPGFAPASGSPFAAGAPPLQAIAADLDGDGITDDVATASVAFSGGGVRVLADFSPLGGFAAPVDPGFLLARAVAAGNLDGLPGDDLAVLDGAGALHRLLGFSGSGFASQLATSTTSAAGSSLAVAGLTQGAPGLCDLDEIATVHPTLDVAVVRRERRTSELRPVPGTGCPAANPVARFAVLGDPVIGATGLGLALVNATPWSLSFLVAEPNAPVGSTPSVSSLLGCGVVAFGPSTVQFFAYTDGFGTAVLPSGLPLDPCLVGLEFRLQWGILDGGPILSTLSVSDGVVLRIGEE